MMSFPAYGSTSAAGSQEQRRSGPISGHAGALPFNASANPPPRKGRARGWHPTQPERHNETPRKHKAVLVWAFGSYVLERLSLLECCRLRSGLVVPVATLRVTIWHQTHLSSAVACQSHASRISATRRGGINFSFWNFWKWESAFYDLCVFGSAARNYFIWRAITHDSFSSARQCFSFLSCKLVVQSNE